MANIKKYWKFFVFALLLVLVFYYFRMYLDFDFMKLRSWIEGFGIFAPMVFILAYMALTVLFLPATPLSISSGVLFGTFWGSVYVIVGASLGALLAFLVSRYFARDFFQDLLKDRLKKLDSYDEKFSKNGFAWVLFLRLIPLFPFNFLNFALGLTRVRVRDYFLGTVLGIIPGVFVYVYLGDSLAMLDVLNIVIAVVLLLTLALVLPVYNKFFAKKNEKKKRK